MPVFSEFARKETTRYLPTEGFKQAVLYFNDGSYLQFEHSSRENRWAKASADGTTADKICRSLRQFRLNAKHLQLYFEDGSDVEFFAPEQRSMLPQSVIDIAAAWWSRDFGCRPEELRPPAARVQEHAGDLIGNVGIWILIVGNFPLISAPPGLLPLLQARAQHWSRSLIQDPARILSDIHPIPVENIVGPAFIGYVTDQTLKVPTHPIARRLGAPEKASVEELRAVCTPQEWEHGANLTPDAPTFGCFDEAGDLCALAGYEVWNKQIAQISVVTSPRARNRGFGAAVTALAAQSALAAGLLPQYRTLVSNEASMRIAKKLGFQEYGFSLYVKIASGL